MKALTTTTSTTTLGKKLSSFVHSRVIQSPFKRKRSFTPCFYGGDLALFSCRSKLKEEKSTDMLSWCLSSCSPFLSLSLVSVSSRVVLLSFRYRGESSRRRLKEAPLPWTTWYVCVGIYLVFSRSLACFLSSFSSPLVFPHALSTPGVHTPRGGCFGECRQLSFILTNSGEKIRRRENNRHQESQEKFSRAHCHRR